MSDKSDHLNTICGIPKAKISFLFLLKKRPYYSILPPRHTSIPKKCDSREVAVIKSLKLKADVEEQPPPPVPLIFEKPVPPVASNPI